MKITQDVRDHAASKEILMSTGKLKRLQAAGWKVGTAKGFLGLSRGETSRMAKLKPIHPRMALKRDFKETVLARAQRDARFREALFTDAINAYMAGDTTVSKAVLHDLVNATIGFEGLAPEAFRLDGCR
jgi:hypothetical protein